MKQFNILSFGLGILTGVIVLLLVGGSLRLMRPSPDSATRNMQGAGQEQRLQRMADTLEMSVADLQKELESGKTMQEIAAERGKELPAGGPGRMGSGPVPSSASGTSIPTGSSVSPASSK